jgi:23S rRNA pseudoU1915 N3-methylase RlmH
MYEPEMQFKSSVMHSGRNDHDPDLNDNAQYASTKFYFQQRRGRLDLRTLSQIDLDKIVRDVDIDVLQMHLENITFSNLKEEDLRFLTDPQVIKLFRTSQLMIEYLLYAQEQLASNLQQMANRYGSKKRSLAKKRIELAELQESTKHLRQEVKTKKNSVAALEHLLKTCSRPRSKRRSHRDHSEEAGEEKQSVQPIRPSVIQFFVSGPDGLCVEFNERATCSIFQLCREVRKAFVTKHDKRSKNDDNEVRLVYHGRILNKEGSIESNGIRPGDTIVAIIDTDKSDDSFDDDSRQKAAISSSSSVAPDVVDLLARQQDAMKNVAQEMRYVNSVARSIQTYDCCEYKLLTFPDIILKAGMGISSPSSDPAAAVRLEIISDDGAGHPW